MFKFFARNSHAAIFFFRLGVGIVFIYRGYLKLFAAGAPQSAANYMAQIGIPFPTVAAYLSGGAEFFGGIMVLLGLLTRQASLFLIFNMIVAITVAHRNDSYRAMEHAVQMLILSVGTLYSGSGSFSLESLVKKHGD
ncbi:DoxX family protein [bacterium]|nr:DoxX family protein [bacterium]